MSLLFDTNAISEPVSARPDAGSMAWFSELSGDDRGPFTTSVTLAEEWQGWYRLPTTHRRRRDLRAWAAALPGHTGWSISMNVPPVPGER